MNLQAKYHHHRIWEFGVAFLVLTILIFGVTHTPAPENVEILAPENAILAAREAYDLNTCIIKLSPHTQLSEDDSGQAVYTVFEGESVSTCFPALQTHQTTEELIPRREKLGVGEVESHVKVVIPSKNTTLLQTTTSTEQIHINTSANSVQLNSVSSTTQTQTNTTEPTQQGSQGGGGGSLPDPTILGLPPLEKFELCRKEVLGDIVPDEITLSQQQALEACLERP